MKTRVIILLSTIIIAVLIGGCGPKKPEGLKAIWVEATALARQESTPTPSKVTTTTPIPTTVITTPTPSLGSLGRAVTRFEVFLAFVEELGAPVPAELTGVFDDAKPNLLSDGSENISGVDFEYLARSLENLVDYYREQPLLQCNPNDIHDLCPFLPSTRCLPVILKMLQIHGPEYNPTDECQGYFDDDLECKNPCTIWAEAFKDEGCYAFLERPPLWHMEGEFYEEQLANFFLEDCK